MKSRKRKAHGAGRPSPKALKTVRDQLAQWVTGGGLVRLIVSHGVQPLHIIGRLAERPPLEKDEKPDFDFHSLSGEVCVPLVPELCASVRVESIGDRNSVVMESENESVSVRTFDVPAKPKADAREIEMAYGQLRVWVSEQTTVLMIAYGSFFAWSLRGQLRRSVTDGQEFFHLRTEENLFGAAIMLNLAESVAVRSVDQAQEIWVKGPAHQIVLSEFHNEESLAKLLQSSGGRVN